MPIINRIADYAPDLKAWRRHLHMHPELALDCHETAGFVAAKLRDFGVDEVHVGIARTGIVALIHGSKGPGPVTGLRADMDALPMDEETGAEHASTVPGRMHACGHDGHTTMLLATARYLSETRNFRGTAALIFQPAEEIIGGGRIMVEEGIMDRFGIEEVYALHTDPFAELGQMRTRPGPIMAAVDDFVITLTGVGGHAAYPHECVDPLAAAVSLYGQLQTIVSRSVKPLDPLVVSVTQIHGGSAMNVIPEVAQVMGTVRSFDPEVRQMAEDRIRAICAGVGQSHGVRVDLDYDKSYPPTVNHAAQTAKAVEIAAEVVGPERVDDDYGPEMGSEDFSYMLNARPGCFLFLGQGIGPSCHHPKFDFNDDAAPIGASFFCRLIERLHA
ncbi:amidohydrolase [Loktanella sp. IMCC34160]|uniref:M20 aminoacylase family protein n=1 Tax=Loktanella sp. IMCC34160 TaxID=2510646 RepID=UPI00101C822F|nr:M20 aminoacylase family protein [Loktanella sp. IMCC34160]RYG93197.1 amidohydrolase [Loktanella sp. IMCC34160]